MTAPEDKKKLDVEEIRCPESTNIHSALFDPNENHLVIRFKEDRDADTPKSAYVYTAKKAGDKTYVREIWAALKSAISKGQYVRKVIVNNPKLIGEKAWDS